MAKADRAVYKTRIFDVEIVSNIHESVSMDNVSDTGAAGNKTMIIERTKAFQLWNDEKLELRAQVCLINDRTFVGISKFWFNADAKRWYPGKKGHLYISPAQWRALAIRSHAITQAVNATEKRATEVPGSSGI
jgi:hypothetical protein